MDKITIFNYPGPKPAFLIVLCIKDEKKVWVIHGKTESVNKRNRLAFELSPETLNNENELKLCGEGKLSVEYCKKKKIKFTLDGLKNFSGSYIFYIPSWGYHTSKKIWVLIPVAKK